MWYQGVCSHFNSIKVRLKPSLAAASCCSSQAFQFHKGTIKTYTPASAMVLVRNFNSIKVRLKLFKDSTTWRLFLFQFHKGTIKTPESKCKINIVYKFQFHKGTIKTGEEDGLTSNYIDFNSIKVRLKLDLSHRHMFTSQIFQFHKGTIKTFMETKLTFEEEYFNSIKVRLKLQASGHSAGLKSFQFHKGTIKTLLEVLSLVVFSHFNSIKVRLKLCMMSKGEKNTLFQFHKGTIKTGVLQGFHLVAVLFQFHKGTIKTFNTMLDPKLYSHFNSIKVRLKQELSLMCHFQFFISIP